jgi:hypothetical protein
VAHEGTRQDAQSAVRPPDGDAVVVVVPRLPGPLRRLDDPSAQGGDELDQMIDEVLGPTTDEGPGIFDVILVVAGIALIVWSAVIGGGGPWFAIGVVSLILGFALPARSLVRAATVRRSARRRTRVLRTGVALDVTDTAVAELVDAYETLRQSAALPDVTVSVSGRALEAGHAALLEVASLLEGRRPVTGEERTYVERRTIAIRGLVLDLVDADRTWRRSMASQSAAGTETARERAAAVVRAREELEATAGVGAVDELDRLRAELRDRAAAGDPDRDRDG